MTWTSGALAGFFSTNALKNSKSGKFMNVINIYENIKKQFIFAVAQAYLTGTVLAHYLLKSTFCDDRALTIVGFSLGGVVTFNCLRMLNRMADVDPRSGRILCDINLLAAAYVTDLTNEYDEIKEKSEWCKVVNGRLNNLFSKADSVLKTGITTTIYPGKKAAGSKPIFTELKEEDKENCKEAINYDLTVECPEHGSYAVEIQKYHMKVNEFY